MNKSTSPLSLRTSKKLKTKLIKLASKKGMNLSEFLIAKIKEEYEYIQALQKFICAYKLIDNIVKILNDRILDKHNTPYDEFNNDFLLSKFYTIKDLRDNICIKFVLFDTGYDCTKTEHISVRTTCKTIEKLNYIAYFYECKKSDIILLILSKNKNNKIIADIMKCFCYITDIINYFYEKYIDDENFEKEYKSLLKIVS